MTRSEAAFHLFTTIPILEGSPGSKLHVLSCLSVSLLWPCVYRHIRLNDSTQVRSNQPLRSSAITLLSISRVHLNTYLTSSLPLVPKILMASKKSSAARPRDCRPSILSALLSIITSHKQVLTSSMLRLRDTHISVTSQATTDRANPTASEGSASQQFVGTDTHYQSQ